MFFVFKKTHSEKFILQQYRIKRIAALPNLINFTTADMITNEFYVACYLNLVVLLLNSETLFSIYI